MKTSRRWPRLGTLAVKALAGGLVLVLMTGVLSCGIKARTKSLLGRKVHLEIRIDEKANHNNPIALDYVLVYDAKLLDQLIQLPARIWFQKKEQFRRDYPDDKGFALWEWEWVPGQVVKDIRIPIVPRAKGALIFANYFSEDGNRARVDPHRSVRISLLEKSFVVEPR